MLCICGLPWQAFCPMICTRLLCVSAYVRVCKHVEIQSRELRFLTHDTRVYRTQSFLCEVEVSPFLYLEQEGHPQQRDREREKTRDTIHE